MRIITGLYRGRHFDIPRTFKARPTTDFAKENIFNVLQGYIDLEGADALDLFSGTGSISLELLSRGCRRVVSVEKDRDHAAFIRQCTDKLRLPATQQHLLVRGDALKFVKGQRQGFHFIFADPPYALPQLGEIPGMVLSGSLLLPGGVFVLEHGRDHDFSAHPLCVDCRTYGSVHFSVFRAAERAGE